MIGALNSHFCSNSFEQYSLFRMLPTTSGARTNWKDGGGHRSGEKRRKFCVWSYPFTFFGSKSTIGRFDERFRDGQYSLVSFLFAVFLYSRCPRAQPFVKVAARAHAPYGVGATAHNSSNFHVFLLKWHWADAECFRFSFKLWDFLHLCAHCLTIAIATDTFKPK